MPGRTHWLSISLRAPQVWPNVYANSWARAIERGPLKTVYTCIVGAFVKEGTNANGKWYYPFENFHFAFVRATRKESRRGTKVCKQMSHRFIYYSIFAIEIARFLAPRTFPRPRRLSHRHPRAVVHAVQKCPDTRGAVNTADDQRDEQTRAPVIEFEPSRRGGYAVLTQHAHHESSN